MLQQNFPAKMSVCIIILTSTELWRNSADRASTQTDTQTSEDQSLAEIPSPWEASLDQNSAFTQVYRSTPTSLQHSPPLTKTLN